MNDVYFQPPISNGNPYEQALIRRWWTEQKNGVGELVWEYYVAPYYIDAVWFSDSANDGIENPGLNTTAKFPIEGRNIVLCEAKARLTPELIGQALVYSELAKRAGANVEQAIVFCNESNPTIQSVAEGFGLEVVKYAQQGAAADP